MGTTFKELYQRVFLRLDKVDGKALLAAKEAINDAQYAMCRVSEFDDLKSLKTDCMTVAGQMDYNLGSDWALTRPKDIYTLRYMDQSSSRKLTYISPSELDDKLPYPDQLGSQAPKWYTRRGDDISLIPIPNEANPVYVYYSKWPYRMLYDESECDFNSGLDDVIIGLGTEIAKAILEGSSRTDWGDIARGLLFGSSVDNSYRPDNIIIHRPFQPGAQTFGEYWKDPFIKKKPT